MTKKPRARTRGLHAPVHTGPCRSATIPAAPAHLVRTSRARSAMAAHRDPYHILVSEIMLQQTQVDRVLPKYAEWLDKYPSLDASPAPTSGRQRDLAAARLQHPPEAPSGNRPRSGGALRRPAAHRRRDAAVVQGHRRLHGRRDSQLRVPAARRHSRHQRGPSALPGVHRRRRSEEPRDEEALWAVSEALVPNRHVFDFNQALMDFGAMVCVAETRNVSCARCRKTAAPFRSCPR